MTSGGDPVPAVTEAAATDEVAAVFADVHAVSGVQVVNLVWRHPATLPVALPACWAALRQVCAAGVVEEAAAAFRDSMALPAPSPLREALPAARPADGAPGLSYKAPEHSEGRA